MEPVAVWLAEKWMDQLGPAIGSMTGAGATASRGEMSDRTLPAAGDLKWKQPLSAAPDAALWIAFSDPVWKGLGRQVLEAAGLESTEEAEVRGTAVEILQQSLSPLSTALGVRLQREVALIGGEPIEADPPELEWFPVEISSGGAELGRAWIAANPALLSALTPAEAPEPPEAAATVRRPSPTMDLLLEVELPVGVSFGRAQMRLKDAVKLTTGSIVELNRSITEPVEVLVNNCVIARGEVVVVEGNYGVKIKQIVSREERLRTLF
jgi:flagellar motor switch protein FliN/FliY